jgi:hypothetical protein
MENSFIKKIVTIPELQQLSKDIFEHHFSDHEQYGHVLGLKHDPELITKCLSHESLLIWNMHVWGHFNGEKWDAVFIGSIRKSEKFNKKFMDEYLWLAKNSNAGIKLYSTAYEYAKSQGCDYISMNVVQNNPASPRVKDLYLKLGFEKDSETYIKKI